MAFIIRMFEKKKNSCKNNFFKKIALLMMNIQYDFAIPILYDLVKDLFTRFSRLKRVVWTRS